MRHSIFSKDFGLKVFPVLGASAILLTSLSGCADRNKNGQPDDVATSGEVSKTADKAGDAAENAADSVAGSAKNLDDAAVITPKVKSAIIANPSLKALDINVDTTDKDVTLSGNVKNAQQKNLAAAIAKKNAPGYQIKNNLKVAGGASPKMNR